MGDYDLFTLPEEWGPPLSGQGSFCQACISRYSMANWRAWIERRSRLDRAALFVAPPSEG
jgi:hypothetical protein